MHRSKSALFDHFVGASEEWWRHGEVEENNNLCGVLFSNCRSAPAPYFANI